MQLRLTDTSLRDGSHHKRHQVTVEDSAREKYFSTIARSRSSACV